MNRNAVIAIVIVVILVVIGGGYFLFGNKITTSLDKNAPTPGPTSTTGNRHEAVSDITVEGTEYQFSPSTIVAKLGKTLTINFKNTGKMPHDFAIKELKVATKVLQPGQSETITVTPKDRGMFMIECTVPGHAAKGMRGLLMIQ